MGVDGDMLGLLTGDLLGDFNGDFARAARLRFSMVTNWCTVGHRSAK